MYPGAPTRRTPVPRILWSASIPATSADTRSVRSSSSGRSSPQALRSSGTCASLSRPASRTTRPFAPWVTPIQQSTATCTEARAAPGHSDELPLRTLCSARPITAGCDALSTPCTRCVGRWAIPGESAGPTGPVRSVVRRPSISTTSRLKVRRRRRCGRPPDPVGRCRTCRRRGGRRRNPSPAHG
jgi:hypothetical protein